MNSQKAINEIINIEKILKEKLNAFGSINQASDAIKVHRVDVSAFMNNRRTWSFEKMAKILARLEEKDNEK